MWIQWTRVRYLYILTRQSYPPISHFNIPCKEVTIVWSMFVYTTFVRLLNILFIFLQVVISVSRAKLMMIVQGAETITVIIHQSVP